MIDKTRVETFFENARVQLEALEEKLLALEGDDIDLDAETVDTKMTIKLRGAKKAEWVLSTNSGAMQLWIAAVGKSWKLDEDGKGGFVLPGTGQNLQQVVEECLSKHYGRKIAL